MFCNQGYSTLLSRSLSLWSLFVFIPLTFQFESFFGENNLILNYFVRNMYSFSYVLFDISNLYLNAFALFTLFVLAFINLFYEGKFKVVVILLQFILIQNLQVFIFPSLSSGWIIIRILFSYLILSEFLSIFFKELKADFFLIPLIRVQVLVIYIFAFLSKMTGTDWIEGSAVKISLMHPQYSLFSEYIKFVPNFIFEFINYTVLFYQLVFIIVFSKMRIRKYILLFGFIFHLFTFLLFGLWTFFISMSLGLLSFYYYDQNHLYSKE
jgi:hypothetical protein